MILLLLLAMVTAVATAVWPEVTASLFFSVALFAVLLAAIRGWIADEDRAYLTRIAILAFGLRLACAYGVEAFALIEKHDALKYHVIGSIVLQDLQAGRFEAVRAWFVTSGHPGYYLLIALIYWVFGQNMMLAQNLNAVASALTVIPIYLLGRELSPDPRVARLAALAFACFPNSIFWSTQLLKDSLIVLIEVMVALDLVRLLKRGFHTGLVIRLLITTALLSELRFYLPVLIYGSCGVAYLVTGWAARGKKGRMGSALAGVLLAGLVVFGATNEAWKGYIGSRTSIFNLEEYRASAMGGDSDFNKGADLSSPGAVAKFLPVATVYFLAGPLPWEARKLSQYLTWMDIPIWYPALLLGVAGLGMLRRLGHALPVVGISIGLTLFYSLFLANLGTAYRMRLQVIPFYLIAAAAYWYRSSNPALESPAHPRE